MGFMDKLKQKAEEYDLQGKADKLAQQIEKGTQQAVEKAGEYAHENRDKIATGIDKAGAKFDEQTQGKYSDKVAKAKDLAAKGVDKVAEQRTGAAGAAEGTSAYGASEPGPQDATPQDAVHPPTYGASSPTTPTAPTTGTPGTTPTPSAGATPPPGPADPSI